MNRWAKLWRTCVGWDRGSSIAIGSDGSWCLMVSGNRVGDWHAPAADLPRGVR